MWEANFTVKGSARFHTPPKKGAAGGPVWVPGNAVDPFSPAAARDALLKSAVSHRPETACTL